MYMLMIESKFLYHFSLRTSSNIYTSLRLIRLSRLLQNQKCNACSFRQQTSLLTDIVYFLACQESNCTDPFDVQILKPNRERQKLIREQNILKQVNFS
jgi:hypothetical protein